MELKAARLASAPLSPWFQSHLYGIERLSCYSQWPGDGGFNRTFMELKATRCPWYQLTGLSFNRTFMELKAILSLCVPTICTRFNRTFMELKVGFIKLIHSVIYVSIAPLWNWKYRCTLTCISVYVSIAPLWNWKKASSVKAVQAIRFNRTFMELKGTTVVAIPVSFFSFNRTFMELKVRQLPVSTWW